MHFYFFLIIIIYLCIGSNLLMFLPRCVQKIGLKNLLIFKLMRESKKKPTLITLNHIGQSIATLNFSNLYWFKFQTCFLMFCLTEARRSYRVSGMAWGWVFKKIILILGERSEYYLTRCFIVAWTFFLQYCILITSNARSWLQFPGNSA